MLRKLQRRALVTTGSVSIVTVPRLPYARVAARPGPVTDSKREKGGGGGERENIHYSTYICFGQSGNPGNLRILRLPSDSNCCVQLDCL